jgi:hypothetical protein
MGGMAGGGDIGGSWPFLSDAPGGRSTVSKLEVEEMSVGSEISCFATDRLRFGGGRRVKDADAVAETGVGRADDGGVEEAEYGGLVG